MKRLAFILIAVCICTIITAQQPSRSTLVNVAKWMRTNFLYPGGGLNLKLTGKGMTMYLYENGSARDSHQEFQGRVKSQGFSFTSPSSHPTAMAGVINAGGVKDGFFCKGIAYESDTKVLPSHSITTNEYIDEILLISCHPYGNTFNSIDGDNWQIGAYTDKAANLDRSMAAKSFWLPVQSGGNDGEKINDQSFIAGFDMLAEGRANAKNPLVVANANVIQVNDNDGKFISATINSTSSRGPTDDLRIKPDITAPGTNLLLPAANSDDSYAISTGTSPASSAAGAALLLLQQHFQNTYQRYMWASTIKGLAMHTADDIRYLNEEIGPDVRSGYGLINAKAAAQAISNRWISSHIEELVLPQGSTYYLLINTDGTTPLQASICWTDPAGEAINTANSITPVLVNDLDLRVLNMQTGEIYSPWRLTPESRIIATKGDNIRDPFERVDVPTSSAKQYKIIVSHKGNLKNDKQRFSLIVTGMKADDANCFSDIELSNSGTFETISSIQRSSEPGVSITSLSITDPGLIKANIINISGNIQTQTDELHLEAITEVKCIDEAWIKPITSFVASIQSCSGPDRVKETRMAMDADKMQQKVIDSAMEIKVIDEAETVIYPNPTDKSFTVESQRKEITKIRVIGLDAKPLILKNYLYVLQAQIDISRLAAGTYIVEVTKSDGKVIRTKLVKGSSL